MLLVLPSSTYTLAFVRGGSADAGFGGVSYPSVGLVLPMDPTGEPQLESFESLVVHEAAHQWFGIRRTSDVYDMKWLMEGMPSLLAMTRYPEGGYNDGRLRRGVSSLVQNIPTGQSFNLELHYDASVVSYTIAPYTLAQFHALATGRALTDADVWALWASHISSRRVVDGTGHESWEAAPYASELTSAEVRYAMDSTLGFAFCDEWVDEARTAGTPLLAISSIDYGDERDTGDTGAPAAGPSVTVTQIQVADWGWPVYSTVPFYLGCFAEDGVDSMPSFATCNASRTWAEVGAYAVGSEHTVIPLSGAVADAWPSRVAIVSNHLLLPEHLPTYGVSDGSLIDELTGLEVAPTWLLRCPPASDHGACLDDVDADGYPLLGDCQDGDAMIHPGATEDLSTDADDNCDGWR